MMATHKRPGSDSHFIAIDGGMAYVDSTEIVGVAWEAHYDSDVDEKGPIGWKLKVAFRDFVKYFYTRRDQVAIMSALGLPINPPK